MSLTRLRSAEMDTVCRSVFWRIRRPVIAPQGICPLCFHVTTVKHTDGHELHIKACIKFRIIVMVDWSSYEEFSVLVDSAAPCGQKQ